MCVERGVTCAADVVGVGVSLTVLVGVRSYRAVLVGGLFCEHKDWRCCSVEIDQEAFCAWLCAREDEMVGHPGTFFHSPLAEWLSEMTGQVYGVDGKVYGRASTESHSWRPLPRWAEVFTSWVESCSTRTVTGLEAFAVLARVEAVLVPGRSSHTKP